ncbi:MAG: co-chaperone GroES [Chloroflexi bacterium]|nr:co-chaperone GroES [Chloroflexota bacterium]
MPDKKLSKFRPMADRVIVEPLEPEAKTASGLLLPETIKDKRQEGLVVAIGPGRWDAGGNKRIEMQVSPRDKVVFTRYSGMEIRIDDKKYVILGEEDILAVLES